VYKRQILLLMSWCNLCMWGDTNDDIHNDANSEIFMMMQTL